jgi:hypothetical protein
MREYRFGRSAGSLLREIDAAKIAELKFKSF